MYNIAMKVSSLKKGMMIQPAKKNAYFAISSYEGAWLRVAYPHRRSHFPSSRKYRYAIYLGTRADVGETNMKWCDRFVLCGDVVAGVDPYAWRNIEVMNG